MGAVHLARDEVLGREVAIKKIGMLPGATMPDLARAEREARLAATLNHPHVVSVFDLVEEGDQKWLVMEYVNGKSLAERIRDSGPLDHATAASIMWQVADALAAAHRAGIMHRDVKPSNIMVTEEGRAKLTDFGIARAQADASLTQTGLVTGSPAYLAPEVASGTGAGAAADVWSLGATLFHALTGKPPYDVSDNLIGGLYKIVHEEPPRVPDAGGFAELLEATMTREPSDRWSMERVRDRLAELKLDPTAAGVTSTAVLDNDPEYSTEVLPTVPPVVAVPPVSPVPAPAPAPVASAVSAPAAYDTDDSRDDRSRWPWFAALALAAVAAIVFSVLMFTSDDDDPPAADEPTSQAPTTDTSEEPTEEPTEEPPTEPTGEETTTAPPANPAAETRRDVAAFITTYLATAPNDQAASFEMLTPGFQAASNGFARYSGYWQTIASATPRNIVVNPKTLTVTYDVDYVRTDGSAVSESVTLQLQRSGDGYLIAAEGA
ncbi:MAG: serine/threonine protein kinase [Nocardioides sp.]|jgi:serine/threonine protein kinase|nr:serine/threonine protein kinase [Nocardioides sp.]